MDSKNTHIIVTNLYSGTETPFQGVANDVLRQVVAKFPWSIKHGAKGLREVIERINNSEAYIVHVVK